MTWWALDVPLSRTIQLVRRRVLPGIPYLYRSTIRACGNCLRRTVIVALGPNDEFCICLRCRANLRYEMLAQRIRQLYPSMGSLDIVELDFESPLRPLLRQGRTYIRSFYRPDIAPGTARPDGSVCQDITRLTFADSSLDLIVSSDVLEHVPDARAALLETSRVLRPGGVHVFTVPPRPATRPRARFSNGTIEFLMPAEYHYDPLDPAGVLSFWDYGPDMQSVFKVDDLDFAIVSGPRGPSNRIVWEARKRG